MALTKHQKFTVERVWREAINGAPYNPRAISPAARKKLQRNLEKVGLIEPVVVNKRTMTLVGGHQRLAALDAIEGSSDYELDVSMCSLTKKVEKEQNIFLNNPAAQGEFDRDLLAELLKDPEIAPLDTGFTAMEVEVLFDGDPELSRIFSNAAAPEEVQDSIEGLEQMADAKAAEAKREREVAKSLNQIRSEAKDGLTPKERLRKFTNARDEKRESEFYAVAVFYSKAEREAFMAGVCENPNAKYIDGRELADKCGVALPEPLAEPAESEEPETEESEAPDATEGETAEA